VEFVCGQLDPRSLPPGQKWDTYSHLNPRSFPHLRFLRYANSWLLVVLYGADTMVGIGSQAVLYGAARLAPDGSNVSYPTADYKVDGISGEWLAGNA
jgi:hypothetical protein